MIAVELSESTVELLKQLAEPLVDTYDSVVARAAKIALELRTDARGAQENGVIRLDPDSHGNLAFTRVTSASIGGRQLNQPKWNSLMVAAHQIVLKHAGSFEGLQAASNANLRKGRHETDGYKFVSNGGFSIQGVDSNLAWDHSLRLARHAKIPLTVKFEWRDKEGAANPGKAGVIEWSP